MIEGCFDWQLNGFIRPTAVQVATEDYFETQDIFKQWLDENCELHKDVCTSASALYADWKAYADSRNEKPGTTVSFAERLTARGFAKSRTRNGIVYDGLAIRDIPVLIPKPLPGHPHFPSQI